jgi:hypothetical protein
MLIPGHGNAIEEVPSRSFGCHSAWRCATDSDILTLFNSMFPLPNQQSWTVFHPNYKVAMYVILALQMQPFKLDGWRRLPKVGKHVGKIGAPTSGLWDWIHTCNTPLSKPASDASWALLPTQEQASMAGQKVQSCTVSGAITAIGQTIAMACNNNPTKVVGSEKFLPSLQVMM